MTSDKNCSIFSTISLFALIVISFTGLAGAEINVGFSPAQINVEENESFTIAIIIEPDTNVSGVELELSYEPSLINITSITEGNFFKQGGKNTIFSKGNIDNELGTVTGIYSVIMGDDMSLESGTFLNITLASKNNSGIAVIEINNVVITNSAGDSLEVTVNNAKVNVGDVEVEDVNEETSQSQQSGQNTLIPLVCAIMCLYFVKRK
ncbi:cohesin domain-containing protein [Methanolobus sp. ZRKC5]|uniref:cohesin domain-containing protein n=1 Tax=unclassified Methanolobus TaxID=2629569 RepID=UPI00313BFD84